MQITVYPSHLCGEFDPPPSKSHALRIIVAALLSDKPTEITGIPFCGDVTAAINCATALGARWDGRIFYPPEKFERKAILDCGESGTALRFFLCVTAAIGGEYVVTGAPRLMSRPTESLISALESGGVSVVKRQDGYCVSGKLLPGRYEIDCSETSQFLSGLLFVLPLMNAICSVKASGLVSAAYVDMTERVMRDFGIKLRSDGETFTVYPGAYSKPDGAIVDADWSGGAFLLAGGALSGKVTAHNVDLRSLQSDLKIIELLRLAGATVTENGDCVMVEKKPLRATEIDCSDVPDLAPIIAVVGAYSEGVTRIKNAARLKTKESDRVVSVTEMIKSLGGNAEFSDGDVIIRGLGGLSGGKVRTFGDHRIAMAAAIAASGADSPVIIDNCDCVKKSYVDFWRDYVSCGGIISIEETTDGASGRRKN